METLKLSDRELRLGFTFDHDKCIVCGACVDACNRAYGGNWRVLPVFELEGARLPSPCRAIIVITPSA